MKVSAAERLILINQYRLLGMLDDSSGRERWLKSAEALERGYPLEHLADVALLNDGPDLTEAQVEAVHSTLAIWQILGDAAAEHGPAFECGPFPGYGPGEECFGRYAESVLDQQEYLGVALSPKTGSVVSDKPQTRRYDRQIEAWIGMGRPGEPTLVQLKQLRDA